MFKHFLPVFLLVFGFNLIAQNNVNNIYSYYHLGLFERNENAYQMALGGVRYGLVDSMYANANNPAVLAYHSKGQPIFSFDVAGRLSSYSSPNDQANTRIVYMSGINFAIPFKNRWGLGFGYRPLTSKGYRFNEYQVLDGDSLNRIYQGSGNIQQTYFSLAFAPIKNAKTFVSLGVEGNFNFGQPTNVRAIEYVSSSLYNAANIYSDTIRGFGFKASLAAKHSFSDRLSMTLGANYTLSTDWQTRYTDRIIGYAGSYGVNHQVTQVLFDLNNMEPIRGTITTPSVIGVGFGISYLTKKDQNIRVHADYENIAMNLMKRDVPLLTESSFNYQNTTGYKIGIEFTPQMTRNINSMYMRYVSYRVGLNLSQIAIPNQNVNDRGMTFGFGFPMKTDLLSSSMINVGVRMGQVGADGVNSIRENYISYQIGIMLRPTTWQERWFRKYQYN